LFETKEAAEKENENEKNADEELKNHSRTA